MNLIYLTTNLYINKNAMEGIIIYRYCITRKRPFKQTKKKQRKLKMNKKK